MFEEENVQLLSSKSQPRSKRRGRRARSHDEEVGDQLYQLSDSESSKKEGDAFEETAMLSDSLYGDSLPSLRAQLAVSQSQLRNRRRDQAHDSRTNLDDSVEDEQRAITTALDDSLKKTIHTAHGQYKSLGGPVVLKRRTKRDSIIKYLKYFKVSFLTLFIVICVILFAVNSEHEEENRYLTLRDVQNCNDFSDMSCRIIAINYTHKDTKDWKFVTVRVKGPFIDSPCNNNTLLDECENFVILCGVANSLLNENDSIIPNELQNCHSFRLTEKYNGIHPHENYETVTNTLEVKPDMENFTILFLSVDADPFEFEAIIVGEILADKYQVIIAAIILVGVYILIGFDIVHRTMAAFIGSTCTLGVLSMLHKRPTLEGVVEWLDLETICLLFGMMTLVGIFSQTGFFDYSAVKAYKLARGKVWPLITLLCLFSAVVSAFLDNVTTILLLTPVSIRLCQVLNLDPRPVLIAEVVFSNIGGTATAVGDPPNVIIVSNKLIRSEDIDFMEFTLHLFLGILLATVAAYLLLSLIYYVSFIRVKNTDPPHIAELKREVAIWERTAQRLNVVSLEERAVRDAILAKATDVRNQLNQEVVVTVQSSKDLWQKNLAELESKYRITNWVLLIKSSMVLAVVILMFFISNLIPKVELELGWIAIFGGVTLILFSDIQDLESILHKIEWGTLLFFAGLFVLMEGLGELGLIRFIGNTMIKLIRDVPEEHQMLVAILLVLWVSAIASSFIDNIPFTTATIPVIYELGNSPDLCLSLRPLVWALAFGACLGGNGTLIGASANVVCAGIAEQNGYKISFMSFFKIGFPMMLVTTFAAMIYLLICHVAFDWNVDPCMILTPNETHVINEFYL